jgi:hypothetical protein
MYTKVLELVDLITRNWDVALLKSLFFYIDVNWILEIPLNNQGFNILLLGNIIKKAAIRFAQAITFNGDTRMVREQIYLRYLVLLQQTPPGSLCGN